MKKPGNDQTGRAREMEKGVDTAGTAQQRRRPPSSPPVKDVASPMLFGGKESAGRNTGEG